MRIFTASLGTETNTYAPIPTDRNAFESTFYAPPGKHPQHPTLCSAPIVVLRRRAQEEGFELVEGTAAFAEPGGLVSRQCYEGLRDEILSQLVEAMPVDGVVLGLHGAMIAQGYDDCEGDLQIAQFDDRERPRGRPEASASELYAPLRRLESQRRRGGGCGATG